MTVARSLRHAVQASGVAILLAGAAPAPATMQEIIVAAPESDWQAVDPSNLLVMQLEKGRVVIVLAPEFAPNTIQNIKTLAREKYFDGSAILRAQDNYVVQWARWDARAVPAWRNESRLPGAAKAKITAEFDRPIGPDLSFTALSDPDSYAPEVGFSNNLPVARDPKEGRTWITHCYGVVGVARGNDADTGNGAELYVDVGESPRNLDRNTTLVGRVVEGMEFLATVPRGTGVMGFYQEPEKPVPVVSIRLGSDMPEGLRPHVEVLRTDSVTFAKLVEERRTRRDAWYKHSPGHIGVCNMPLPAVVK